MGTSKEYLSLFMNDRLRSIQIAAGRSMRPAVFLSLATFCGCSPQWPSDYPGAYQPVTGRITLDGKPVEHIHVTYVPQREGGTIASGETDESGGYRLSNNSTIGTPPCDYRVILSYRTDPKGVPVSKAMDSSLLVPLEVRQAIERLPAKYSTKNSELMATVRDGENVIDFDLNGPLEPIPKLAE
jgi:hypothetical protein